MGTYSLAGFLLWWHIAVVCSRHMLLVVNLMTVGLAISLQQWHICGLARPEEMMRNYQGQPGASNTMPSVGDITSIGLLPASSMVTLEAMRSTHTHLLAGILFWWHNAVLNRWHLLMELQLKAVGLEITLQQ